MAGEEAGQTSGGEAGRLAGQASRHLILTQLSVHFLLLYFYLQNSNMIPLRRMK